MDLNAIKSVYFLTIAVIVVVVIAMLVWIGFVQPVASEGTYDALDDQPWDILYLGTIGSQVIGDERQERVNAFIEHNAGISDVCEIMHFYSYSCAACMRLEPWIEEFRERYPEVLFTSYEIHDDASRVQLESTKQDYGMSSALVPSIFACGTVLEGVDAIETLFEPMTLSVYNLSPRSE